MVLSVAAGQAPFRKKDPSGCNIFRLDASQSMQGKLILSDFGDKLVDQYFVRVHRYVRMKVCETDCEDLIHDIFLRAIEREDQVKEDTGAWLFAIARSQVAEYYRRRSALPARSSSCPSA